MFRRLSVVLIAGLVTGLIAAAPALACPVCATGTGPTPLQMMAEADNVLLIGPERDTWAVVAVVKGPTADLPAASVAPAPGPPPPRPTAVARDAISRQWAVLGPVGAEHLPWLRTWAAGRPGADFGAAEWAERVRALRPLLEHADPFLADAAYREIARAPYAAMRTLAPTLQADAITRWLDDEALRARAPLYTLLLGVAGGPAATARVDRALADAAARNDPTHLAALLVADLELRGPERLAAVQRTWLSGRDRSLKEVQAALLALSVQGGADATVPRAQVVQTLRTFVRTRHPYAGFAAPDLLDWKAWDAVPDFVALLQARAPQHPAALYAIVNYLDASPDPAARATAAAVRRAEAPR